jgi:trk system potassium uptake protein TrkH
MTVIMAGTFTLMMPFSVNGDAVGFIDALFTSTSAVCVTGLVVLDTGTDFSKTGQMVIMLLIQLGGLGIMTFTSLAFYLVRKKVSFNDTMIIGQTLMHDTSFHLASFLKKIIIFTFVIEIAGAVLLHAASPEKFTWFSASFHAVSAFCNAGFSLFPDSLSAFRSDWLVNLTVMALIISGGIGFSVLVELQVMASDRIKGKKQKHWLSWHAEIVLKTSAMLIAAGFLFFLATEWSSPEVSGVNDRVLSALFQSVTARTAGFNTIDIGGMANVSLLFMMILMFIGGAPGSCAGGIKVTTFMVMSSFILAQIKGCNQAVIGRFAVDKTALNRAVTLVFFTALLVLAAVLVLDWTEGGTSANRLVRGQFLEVAFEAVSALGTVGLSTGLTSKLTDGGKTVIIFLMFIGRLGPLVFLAVIQSLRKDTLYSRPEEIIGIG